MENQFEIWKDVIGYDGIYQVSNLGNVKSLNYKRSGKEQVLKNGKNKKSGYFFVNLFKNKTIKNRNVHQLVAEAFLNHKPCGMDLVINHKNQIKTDNRVENLEIITQRENTNQKHLKSSSKYTGVSWDKKYNKWRARIRIKEKLKYLGVYDSELEASQAYQNALSNITNQYQEF